MNSGIYCIRNLLNKKRYIGSSKNVKARFRRHKCDLNKNRHYNKHLQSAWNKYGSDSFVFETLSFCDFTNLIEIEDYFISAFNALDNKFGYNNEPAHKRVIGKKNKGSFKKGNKAWNKGKKLSVEHKENLIESHIGQIAWNKGKHHSEEQKEKLRVAWKRRKLKKQENIANETKV